MDDPLELRQLDVQARDDRGWTNVHIAVYNNRPEVLDFLLRNGADVCAVSDSGETALHFASSLESQQIACCLLKWVPRDKVRQFLDGRTSVKGTSALHVAAKNGAFGIVWLLLGYGANYEIKNNEDKRPVDVARDRRVRELLHTVELDSRSAEKAVIGLRSRLQSHPFFELDASIHSRNERGLTLLQFAVINEDVDLLETVVELRTCKQKDDPPIELLGSLGQFAKHCDDVKKRLNALTKLCDEATDARLEPSTALDEGTRLLASAFEVTQIYGGEQQHLAVIDETLEVLQFDRDSTHENARFHRKLNTDKKSDLFLFVDVLKLTIGAPIALLMNAICTVYLGASTQRFDLTSVEKCLLTNPDLNVQDANGWTPLHHAVHNDNERMVKALLEQKADATLVTKKNKKTPLHMAVKTGNVKIVDLLLTHVTVEGYVDAKSEPKGLTALHLTAKIGRLDIIKCLLKRSANYCASDKKGRSPVDLAKEDKVIAFFKLVDDLFAKARDDDADVVKKLKCLTTDELMAVANTRNDEGCTLLVVAKSNCHIDVYSELLTIISDAVQSEKEINET